MNVQTLFAPVAEELGQVEGGLDRQVERVIQDPIVRTFPGGEGARIVRHVFNGPGKRLRPGLALLSARAIGPFDGRRRVLIEMAVAVELLHTASLVHDDVIDQSTSRREQVSLNGRYGDRIAVLVGDLLYTQFFQIVAGLCGPEAELRLRLLDRFCNVTRRMCLGEISEERLRIECEQATLERYLQLIDGKTASLMSGACAAGALLNGADERLADDLADYGRYLGLSYQIVDDLLDSDSVYSCADILRQRLQEYSGQAREKLRRLSRSDAADRLLHFTDALRKLGGC